MHRTAIALILTLVVGLGAGLALAQESNWPRTLEGEKGTITIYQPQLESFQEDDLESRAAVAVERKGQEGLVFGAVWFKARLLTDRETRLAMLAEVVVTAARFPDLEEGQVEELSRFLEQEIPQWNLEFSLDELLADLADQQKISEDSREFNMVAPTIHYRDHAAVLVLVDGDPFFRPLEGSKAEYLANSAFFIVREQGARSLYLRGAGHWFTSQDLTGAWTVTENLPPALAEIATQVENDEKQQAEEMAQDAQGVGAEEVADTELPEVIVSLEPAELLYTTGKPDMAPVAGTQLLYVRNTDSDVLLDIASQKYYLLLAGRWYRSASLEKGPWEFVAFDKLPADFAKIPPESDMGTVLASVEGTREAQEAVLDNQIPQTAEVDRKTAKVEVTFDGDPQFETCGEGVAYGLNTDKAVLLVDGTYYCCDTAIWFVSSKPTGTYQVATEIPDVIQDLPPECPVYNVKYVTIYESTPEVVYVGYTPAYYGSYIYGPCVVYGTGWYYRPWYGHHYYPRPVTYGFGVHYNPYSGWGFTFGISYGWLNVGVGWGRPYHPGYWGAGGYRYGYRHGYWHGYHHGYHRGYRQGVKAGYYAANRKNGGNVYRNRATGIKRTGGDRRPGGKEPRPSDRKNNIYTDRDGKVYRDRDGKWEERDRGEWKSREDRDRQTRDRETPQQKDRDRPTRDREKVKPQPRDRSQQQLDRDRSSRQRGMERQRQAPQRQTPQRQAPRKAPSGGGRRR